MLLLSCTHLFILQFIHSTNTKISDGSRIFNFHDSHYFFVQSSWLGARKGITLENGGTRKTAENIRNCRDIRLIKYQSFVTQIQCAQFNKQFKTFQISEMQAQNFIYSGVSCFTQRPSQNIRFLINRQLPKLIEISISEALQFVNTASTKDKALKQLKYTVLIGQHNVTPHLQKIIKALVKIRQLDIQNVQKTIRDIMSIIGFYVKSNYYLPLMMNILTEDQIKNSNKNIIILLKLISNMLLTSEDIEGHLHQIIKLISTYEALLMESDEGLSTVCQIAMTLTRRLTNLQHQRLVSTIFSVLLNVEATRSISVQFRNEAKQSMQILAKKAGYNSVPQLHSQEVGPVLSNIIDKKQYVTWNKSSKNRFKFDTIVRNCEGQAIRFISQILTILQYCISVDADIEIRIDTLVLIEQMLKNQQVREAMKEYAVRVFLKILNIAIKWKVGHPQIKIRKAGIVNMIKMIQLQAINESQLLECFSQILPNLKACLSDDWAPEVRFSGCQFLQKYLLATKQNIDGDQLKEIYVILLERLDDSQDPIRQKITKALNIFFTARYLPVTTSVSSIMQYMVNAIFIHYDDNKQLIRDAINTTLRFAGQVDPNQVLKTAKANKGKMKHPSQCEQLIEYCQNVIESRKL